MNRVAVLGATGSIGLQTLDVMAEHPDRLRPVALVAGQNAAGLRELGARYGVPRLATYHPSDLPHGLAAIEDLVSADDVDTVVVATAGVIGLAPTLAAIRAGKAIALASKEVLVAAGEPVMAEMRARGTRLTPIDSEHSALFQCMQGGRREDVERLILTASGGPFRGRTRAELANITVEQALNHPTWRMGGKITVDSATLMNKGLEIIEARWLFDLPTDRIDVVVHPQSIVHSLVRWKDGSVLAQLGWPDMRLPIRYALLYPDRVPNSQRPWNPVDSPSLTFEPPDTQTFPALDLARAAAARGGSAPAALNAANEEAVGAFLRGQIGFLAVVETCEKVLAEHSPLPPTLENIVHVDEEARQSVRDCIATTSVA
jgi:1-deoxy-D-xylulose-5-phosphate reductoisomerase